MKTAGMLKSLQLIYALENLAALTDRAALEAWPHQDYLDRLLEGECQRREAGGIARRIKAARFPLRKELRRYTRPALLVVDELGYLPIDKLGADLLFQVFSQRYEQGSTVITTNKTYKHWPDIFNNDATLTSPSSTVSCTTPRRSSSRAPVTG